MIRKKLSTSSVIVIIFLSIISLSCIQGQIANDLMSSYLIKDKIKGSEIFTYYKIDRSKLVEQKEINSVEDEPIFWDLENGSIINYNPVVLFVNYYYWDNLDFYNSSEEYVFEMYANESVIFDFSYEYSRYNQYFWELGYDWNVSEYSVNTNIELEVFFYQETNPNMNHSASINISIGEITETPIIDYESFKINLFHWPGTYYSSGYNNYFYDPTGPNPYYQFIIYDDGYVELKYGERDLYDSNDLSADEAKDLMELLISLGFFQLKDAYFTPGYDYLIHSYYQIFVDSMSTQVWKQVEEAKTNVIKPNQFSLCLNEITNVVSQLYFEPVRCKWEIALIISGSTLGGLSFFVFLGYIIFAFRRRR
ncbi:MAG: hypothetical protein ACFFDW_08965 [Candidatus Thorarchaeota archaeon]